MVYYIRLMDIHDFLQDFITRLDYRTLYRITFYGYKKRTDIKFKYNATIIHNVLLIENGAYINFNL